MIEEIAKCNAAAGSSPRKIADLYNSYMDEAAIEAKGLAPLRPHLDAIAAIRDKHELARALGETLRADVDALNNTNFHTAESCLACGSRPALTIPITTRRICCRADCKCPIANIIWPTTSTCAHSHAVSGARFRDAQAGRIHRHRRTRERILELEHAIAQKHLSLADNEDIHKANNTWTQADFSAKAPGLDWTEYFRAAGLSQQSSFIVWQPTAFTGESALVASTPLETWKDWLAFHLIEASTPECCPKRSPTNALLSSAGAVRHDRSSVRAGSAAWSW